MASRSMSTQIARAQKLDAGTTKHFGGTAQLAFAGGAFTPAEVQTKLQTFVNLRQGVDAAKAAAKSKLDGEKAQAASLRGFIAQYELFVRSTFGNSAEVLADFGLSPKKVPAPLTAAAKTAAAVKRAATRKARGTKGTKQRQLVKGDVTSVVMTPIHAGPSVAEPTAGSTATQLPGATTATPSAKSATTA